MSKAWYIYMQTGCTRGFVFVGDFGRVVSGGGVVVHVFNREVGRVNCEGRMLGYEANMTGHNQ